MGGRYSPPHGDSVQPFVDAVTDTRRQVRDLQRPDSAQYNSTLEALEAQVAQIASLVNTQVSATSGYSSGSGYALGTGAQELARITFTVPSGYTKAQVLAVTSFTCFNQSTTADQLWGHVDINGSVPADQPGWTPPVSGGVVVSEHALSMSGLSAGSTFYVRTVGWNRFGNTGATAGNLNTCVVSAQVLFLR